MVSVKVKGDFKNTERFFKKVNRKEYTKGLDAIAAKGVTALEESTPKDTGATASSWSYSIEKRNRGIAIIFNNSNINKGVNVALLIQYGHGTASGVYVEGIDYINPALKPTFEALGKKVWTEVTSNA